MVAFCRRFPRAARRVLPWVGWLAVATAALSATGCTTRHAQLVDFLRSHEVEVSTGHYLVRPPDSIAIHSPDVPEVDGAVQMIRPDGKVVLRLVGETDVAGLTTEEIAAKLRAQLSRYYVDPEVFVEVVGYRSQFYYVFGEVTGPGSRPYTGRDTLLKALAEAQPTYLAWRSRIRVVRPAAKEGESRVITVDLDRMVKDGDLTYDVLLQEGDVIEVPPTPLAWIGHRVRELLYPVAPVMNAYTTPSDAISATRNYGDDFGSGDNGRGRVRGRRGFVR